MTSTSTAQQGAHYDNRRRAVVIDRLDVTDQAVLTDLDLAARRLRIRADLRRLCCPVRTAHPR